MVVQSIYSPREWQYLLGSNLIAVGGREWVAKGSTATLLENNGGRNNLIAVLERKWVAQGSTAALVKNGGSFSHRRDDGQGGQEKEGERGTGKHG